MSVPLLDLYGLIAVIAASPTEWFLVFGTIERGETDSIIVSGMSYEDAIVHGNNVASERNKDLQTWTITEGPSIDSDGKLHIVRERRLIDQSLESVTDSLSLAELDYDTIGREYIDSVNQAVIAE
jgi:hypothetical protein